MKPPTTDPIVTEVRSARDQHAAKFGHDVRAIFKDIQEQQIASDRKFVRYPARPATASTNKSGSKPVPRAWRIFELNISTHDR